MCLFGFCISETIRLLLIVLLVLKGADFVLGIVNAFRNNEFKAKIMKEGLLLWIAELLALTVVMVFDSAFNLNSILITPTVSLFILKEYSSVNSNLNLLGIQLPNIVELTINKLLKNKNSRLL